MTRLLFLGDFLGNRNKYVHRKKTHAILVVVRQELEQGYHFLDNDWGVHFLNEFCEVIGRLSPHHRCLIVHQPSKILPEALL